MVKDALIHLTNALVYAGLPERYILQEQRSTGESYPTVPIAYLYPLSGNLNRDGSRFRMTPGDNTVRRLWKGRAILRCELVARDTKELNDLIVGMMTWLFDNTFKDAKNNALNLPDESIAVSYTDEEGVLLDQNTVILDFPVELGIFHDVDWVPISVQLEYEIEGGASGE